MRNEIIGVISEGVEDQGVIKNILRAFGFDGSEIKLIRPGLSKDATDRFHDQQSIGTIQGVKNSCTGKDGIRPDFDKAFSVLDCNNIVIHIDTAEIENQDFEFNRPQKENNIYYSAEVREQVIGLISNWLENNYQDKLLYAIAIEEIEAWCLTMFEDRDTVSIVNSKNLLQKHLNKNNLIYSKLKLHPTKNKMEFFEAFTKYKKLHKKEHLLKYIEHNASMKDFVLSLEEKFENMERGKTSNISH